MDAAHDVAGTLLPRPGEFAQASARRGRAVAQGRAEALFAPVTICIVVTALGAALRLYHLGETPAWIDETVVYWLGQETLGRLLSRGLALTGTHPPLFYIVHWAWNHLMGWFGVGPSAVAVRIPSVIIGTASIPLFYAMFRDSFGRRVAVSGAVFLAISPAHVAFSRTAKSEVLIVFLLILTLGFAVRLLGRLAEASKAKGGAWALWRDHRFVALAAGYIISALAMLHTHSLGFVGLFSPSLVFAVQFLRRKQSLAAVTIWAIINLVVVAAFLPWLILLLEIAKAGTGYWWLKPMDSQQIITALLQLLIDLPTPPGAAVSGQAMLAAAFVTTGLMVLGCVRAILSDARRAGIAVALLAVPAVLFALSQAKPVFWGYMLTAFSLPLMALVAGFALAAPAAARRTQVMIVVVMIMFLIPAERHVYGGRPEPWDKVVAYLDNNSKPDDPILFWPPFGEWAVRFYGMHETPAWRTIDLGPIVDFQPLRTVPAIPVADIPQFVGKATQVWLVTGEASVPDEHVLPELRTVLAAHLVLATRVQFEAGLTVYRYTAAARTADRSP